MAGSDLLVRLRHRNGVGVHARLMGNGASFPKGSGVAAFHQEGNHTHRKDIHMSNQYDWMLGETLNSANAEQAARTPERMRFDQITEKWEADARQKIEGLSRELNEINSRLSDLSNLPEDTFPNGTRLLVTTDRERGANQIVAYKNGDGVWYYNSDIWAWRRIVQNLRSAPRIEQITETVVLPQGTVRAVSAVVRTRVPSEAPMRRGRPKAVKKTAEPLTRGQKAARTRAANKAAKAAVQES